MTLETISPAEAWEEVERRQIHITHGSNGEWYAAVLSPEFTTGWGANPLEAVGKLLERLGAETTAKVQNSMSRLERMEEALALSALEEFKN